MYRLKEWGVVYGDAIGFTPPELCDLHAVGIIYDHPAFPDGKLIKTSPVVKADGRALTTYSGSIYILDGSPSQDYLDFLKEIDYEYDDDNPVKIKHIGNKDAN